MSRATIVKSWRAPSWPAAEDYCRHHVDVAFDGGLAFPDCTYRVNVSRYINDYTGAGRWSVEAIDLTVNGGTTRYGEENSVYESFPHHDKACELALALAIKTAID